MSSIMSFTMVLVVLVPSIAVADDQEILSPINREKGFLFESFPRQRLFLSDEAKDVRQRTTSVPDKMECVYACVGMTWCRSINFNNTQSKENGLHTCELMSTQKHSYPKNLTKESSFIHLSIKNPCEEKPCLNGATCIFNDNRQDYKCMCTAGGFLGETCQDIDECSSGSHGCHSNAVCINSPGSFTCQCKSGFTGDGKLCTALPLDIFVQSEACDDNPGKRVKCGTCMIKVNNVEHCPSLRGHNVVVLNKFGKFQKKKRFDTYGDTLAGQAMKTYLDGLSNASIVLIAVQDSGEQYVRDAEAALRSVGAVNPTVSIRSSWLLVGYKGGSPSWVTEKRADRYKGPSQATVKIPVPVT